MLLAELTQKLVKTKLTICCERRIPKAIEQCDHDDRQEFEGLCDILLDKQSTPLLQSDRSKARFYP